MIGCIVYLAIYKKILVYRLIQAVISVEESIKMSCFVIELNRKKAIKLLDNLMS